MRHRRPTTWRGRHRKKPGRHRKPSSTSLPQIVICGQAGLIFAEVVLIGLDPQPTRVTPVAQAAPPVVSPEPTREVPPSQASRQDRPPDPPKPVPEQTTAKPKPPPPPPKPAGPPKPVAGLDQQQMNNAATIVKVGNSMNIPTKGKIVAIATALQESKLRNLANSNVPASLKISNQGVGRDHDSVGLFQQRPSTGWGTVAQCMNPEYASRAFYGRLTQISGWQNMAVTVAAQRVQGSAYPYAYAKHEANARLIVQALGG